MFFVRCLYRAPNDVLYMQSVHCLKSLRDGRLRNDMYGVRAYIAGEFHEMQKAIAIACHKRSLIIRTLGRELLRFSV